jgi:hypothetical protein
MSYCRWSSDNFQCDVYVYASKEGWATHVANSRSEPSPSFPWWAMSIPILSTIAWRIWSKRSKQWSANRTLTPIGLSRDGQSYYDDCPICCADRLQEMKEEGYLVPQYTIDELREEANELQG